ncbi:MAG: ABC transporter permease [Xanthomonadales bacterium]|nr:ABC transporter permease [Xanthomonadales bacterium]
MFKNYLVTAYKVLLRRKFFSFVNLFGIAITLAVLTVIVTMLQNYVKPIGAESRSPHFLAVRNVRLTNEERTSSSTWNAGYRFLERHVLNLETPDMIGFYSSGSEGTVFIDGTKLSPTVVRTDANFWKILDYEFISGRPIQADDETEGRTVAVLNESMQSEIFGDQDAVGRRFTLNGRPFEVVGVVEDEPEMRMHSSGEIWVPHSSTADQNYRNEWIGGFTALLYAEDPNRLPIIRDEFVDGLAYFEYDDPEQYQRVESTADTKFEMLVRDFMNSRFEEDSKAGLFLLAMFGAMIAFMFLPTINLINLNISRILERASEIGVRKAFGAPTTALVAQFLVENLVLSLLGGVIGFFLGVAFLNLIEASGLIAYANFEIDLVVFGAALFMMIIFGLISGVYPALKMARMHPVAALRRA